jgi:hypothetical protein
MMVVELLKSFIGRSLIQMHQVAQVEQRKRAKKKKIKCMH